MRTYLTRWLVLTSCLLLTACWGYSETYTAESIEGWVVDAASKQPIEGVVITANWQLLNMAYPVGQLMVMESVSDSKGRFYFPGWKKENKIAGYIRSEGPLLMAFKNGYKLKFRDNYTDGTDNTRHRGPHLKSEWNGRKIELQKLSGGIEAEFAEYDKFNSELESKVTQDESPCAWKAVPKTIKILVPLRNYFEAGYKKSFSSLDGRLLGSDEFFSSKGCGSSKQFMEMLKQ